MERRGQLSLHLPFLHSSAEIQREAQKRTTDLILNFPVAPWKKVKKETDGIFNSIFCQLNLSKLPLQQIISMKQF